jgi:HK97 family phage portal protein
MLDSLRLKAALALLPNSGRRLVVSDRTPNVPVYSDLTVSRAARQGYKLSIWVYRSVRTIASAFAAVPWLVVDRNGEELPAHPFMDIVRQPNPEFSWQDMTEIYAAHLKLCGNELWQPVMVGGKPREIWPVMPDLVSPIPSDEPGQWLRAWEVRTQHGHFNAPPETFIHFMEMDPGNPYWGTAPLMAAARTVDTDNEAQDTQKVELQNRSVPPGVFQFESPLSAEQHDEASRRVRELFTAKSRRGEPWVLGGGYKWIQMAMTPVEMDYVQSRLHNERAIAAAFGIDPWFLGDREHSTYNNVQEARRALYEDVVIPMLEDMKSTLNLRLGPVYNDGATITYDVSNVPAMRSDYKDKVEAAHKLWSMGVPFEQINQQLELGFSEYPGWDAGYVPLTLVPSKAAPQYQTKAMSAEQLRSAWLQTDRLREAWVPVVAKRYEALYEREAGTITDLGESAVQAAINSLAPDWQRTARGVLSALVGEFGKVHAASLGAEKAERKWEFNPMEAALAAWLDDMAASEVRTILASNLADVRAVIRQGTEAGLSNDEIARNLRQFYADRSPYKAMRIARTETTKASTHAVIEAAKQSGVCDEKMWVTARDDRVRDEHAAMDGETVPLDATFSNGLEGPGEPNCRCAIVTPVR